MTNAKTNDTESVAKGWYVYGIVGADVEVLPETTGIGQPPAPVVAVRGNNDSGPWAAALNDIETVEVADAIICVIHDLAQFDVDPLAAGFHAVVSGHSHRPAVREQEGVLYVNPGSAGPRRFSLPVSVGHLIVAGASVRARLVTLTI